VFVVLFGVWRGEDSCVAVAARVTNRGRAE